MCGSVKLLRPEAIVHFNIFNFFFNNTNRKEFCTNFKVANIKVHNKHVKKREREACYNYNNNYVQYVNR